jgi:hypothetical protein
LRADLRAKNLQKFFWRLIMDLWDKRIVLPFLIDPDESSDKNYLPSKRLARQLLRREIEEAKKSRQV